MRGEWLGGLAVSVPPCSALIFMRMEIYPHTFSRGVLALGLCSLPPPAAAVRRDWARRIFSHVKLLLSYPLIQEPTMSSPPDFNKEDLKGTPAEFAPGAWVLGHAHFAGGAIVQKLMF